MGKRNNEKSAADESMPRTGVPKPKPRPKPRGKRHERAVVSVSRPVCETCGIIHTGCNGHTRNGPNAGKACGANPPAGSSLCIKHGGNKPEIRAAAHKRLLSMVDPALSRLAEIVSDPCASDADALKAIQAILNRTGLSERMAVDLIPREAKPWDNLTDGSALELNADLSEFTTPEELEKAEHRVIENNAHQFARDAQADAWRGYDDEEAEHYERRATFADSNTVRGEVVDMEVTGPLPKPPDVNGPTEHDGAPRRGRYDVPRKRDRTAPPRYEDDPYADRFP